MVQSPRRARLGCTLLTRSRAVFSCRLAQSNSGTTAVLVDEFDAGSFQARASEIVRRCDQFSLPSDDGLISMASSISLTPLCNPEKPGGCNQSFVVTGKLD